MLAGQSDRGAKLLFPAIMKSIAVPQRFCTPPHRARRTRPSILFLLLVIFCAGCNRDPKKFLAKGNASYEHEKYPEALIYYGRAIQLDPRNAEAHFKLAQTQLKLKSWVGSGSPNFSAPLNSSRTIGKRNSISEGLQLAGGQNRKPRTAPS